LDPRKPIPLTPMARRYSNTIHAPEGERLKQAQELALDPAPLAEEFAQSVAAFELGYDNPEAFFPKPRLPPAPKISRTEDLSWYLWKQQMLPIRDHSELNADYVDYEVVATRTTGGAVFDDEQASSAKSGLRLDLLLANSADRTPIVAEVKRERDKDPFTALIQMLASVAHLATPKQYERLRTHFPDAHFAGPGARRRHQGPTSGRYPWSARRRRRWRRRGRSA
jgi:hypothetical protein